MRDREDEARQTMESKPRKGKKDTKNNLEKKVSLTSNVSELSALPQELQTCSHASGLPNLPKLPNLPCLSSRLMKREPQDVKEHIHWKADVSENDRRNVLGSEVSAVKNNFDISNQRQEKQPKSKQASRAKEIPGHVMKKKPPKQTIRKKKQE